MTVPRVIQAIWINACPKMEKKMAGWNRDLSGRNGCMCSKGAVLIGKKKERRGKKVC